MDSVEATENKKQLQSSQDGLKSISKSRLEQDARNGRKYQKRWLLNPLFTDWLQPVNGDPSKAMCSYCYTELRAHCKDLERHAKTKKHIAHLSSSAEGNTKMDEGGKSRTRSISAVNSTGIDGNSQTKIKSQKSQYKRTSKAKIDWSRYKQIYRKRWEVNPALSDWIAPVAGNKYRAWCRFCDCDLRAHYSDLLHHLKTAKHLQNASEYTSKNLERSGNSTALENVIQDMDEHDNLPEESECPMLNMTQLSGARNKYRTQWELDPQFRGWIASVPGNDNKARCKCCRVLIRAHLADLKSHGKTTKHANNSRKQLQNSSTIRRLAFTQRGSSLKSTITYRKNMNDWILPVSDDHRKAQCKYCKVQLSAHHAGLCTHALDKKHLKNVSAAGNAFGNKSLTDRADREFNNARNTEVTSGRRSTSVDNSEVNDRRRKFKSEGSICTQVKSPKHVSFIMTERNEDDSEFLELECETVDERRVATLQNASEKARGNKKRARVPPSVQSHLRQGEHDAMMKRNSNPECHSQTDSVVEDNYSDICDSVTSIDGSSLELDSILLPAQKSTLLKYSKPESRSDMEELEPAVKRRKLNKSPDTESSAEEVTILEVKRELQEDGVLMEEPSSEPVFVMPEVLQQKKRTPKPKIDWKRYKKIYRKEWELDPNLCDWVAPIDGDRYKAACRFCGCVLRAHYTDLQQHRNTAKHSRNAYWYRIKALNPDAEENCMVYENFAEQKDDRCDQTKESKISACYMLSKSPWSRYRKRYRKQWESDPQFQGWIASVPGDDTKARCKYCCILLRAHFADLKNHSRTTKHANNIAYGRPFPDSSAVNRPGFMRTCASSKPTIIGRKKKSSIKSVPALNRADNFDLDRPDDSLAPIGSLSNITTFGWCSSSLPETTLILPKHVHLDEALAASLPKTSPAAMFRVKKEPTASQTSPAKKRKEKLQVQMMPEECNENALQNLTKSVTLWEFLMMKVEKSHPNSTRPKLETILLEFKALQEQVKSLGQQQLIPMVLDDETKDSHQNDVLVIESEELAYCLGVPVGAYKIRDTTNPRMNRNVTLLGNAPRRRTKHSSTVGNVAISHPPNQMVARNSVQELMAAGDSEIQSLVIPSDQLQGVKLIGYDFDRQYADCSNLFTVNGHYEGEGDVQLYVLPISEDMDQETLNTLMQGVPVTK